MNSIHHEERHVTFHPLFQLHILSRKTELQFPSIVQYNTACIHDNFILQKHILIMMPIEVLGTVAPPPRAPHFFLFVIINN